MTLSEVVIAIGLLAIVSLTLIGLFSQLILSGAKNRDVITAELIATEIMERAVAEGPRSDTNLALGWGVGNEAGRVHRYPLAKPSEFVYQVDVQQLDLNGSANSIPWQLAAPTANALDLGHHWLITVKVGWNPDDPEQIESARAGQGLQWVEHNRIQYYQSWSMR